jgi:hypothetical protein
MSFYNPCEKCGERYSKKWCKQCQINNFKNNFKNWTSGNEKIDNFVQEMQLEIDSHEDSVFEWISYNQLNNVKEICKVDLNTVYSAMWIDGPLKYDGSKNEYTRNQKNEEVTLRSKIITDELLNNVCNFFYRLNSINL